MCKESESESTLRGFIVDTGYADEEWAEKCAKEDGVYEVNFGDFFFKSCRTFNNVKLKC